LTVASARIHPGIDSSGANAPDTNMNGIMIIIPANWTTSGRRSWSPIREQGAHRRRQRDQNDLADNGIRRTTMEAKPERDRGGDEDRGARHREQRSLIVRDRPVSMTASARC